MKSFAYAVWPQLPEPHPSIITHSKFQATSGSRPYVLQSALHLISVQKPARAHRPAKSHSRNHLMPKLRVFKLVSRVICLPRSRITGGDGGVVCATQRVSATAKKSAAWCHFELLISTSDINRAWRDARAYSLRGRGTLSGVLVPNEANDISGRSRKLNCTRRSLGGGGGEKYWERTSTV